jgi:tetratricopeptide (TPR) repeat protein
MAQRTVDHLLADVQFALDHGMTARDLVPMLSHLWRSAPVGSEISRFARLQLGRQLLETDPFRAASLARSVVREHECALSLLGCFRAAAKAHKRACLLAPAHPAHAHNLGHLLDAGFGRPKQAIPWLKRAFVSAPDVPGIASSYAHALVGVGRIEEARTLLRKHGRLDPEGVDATVQRWLLPPASVKETG